MGGSTSPSSHTHKKGGDMARGCSKHSTTMDPGCMDCVRYAVTGSYPNSLYWDAVKALCGVSPIKVATDSLRTPLSEYTVDDLYAELKSRPSVDRIRLLNAIPMEDVAKYLDGLGAIMITKETADQLWNIADAHKKCPKPKENKADDKPWWADSLNPDVD